MVVQRAQLTALRRRPWAYPLRVDREILHSAFREIRTLVAATEPAEVVALVNLQLVTILPRASS